MKNQLQQIIDNKHKWWAESPDEMIAAYNQENEIVQGYNGRQILELIQNCDDEKADKVHITLDKEHQIFSIANTGKPFSLEGYKSLFIPMLSAKLDKKQYIGNKGLGFRSIINWSNKIDICSNDLQVSFSNQIKKSYFNAKYDSSVKEMIEAIKAQRRISSEVTPIPLLACPFIKDKPQRDSFTTKIMIHYKKEYLDDIIDQISTLQEEVVLFLHSVETITFEGFNQSRDIVSIKEDLNPYDSASPSEKITVNDNDWYIFSQEGDIDVELKNDEEKQYDARFYQIKLAIDFNNTSARNCQLYSFFPTQVKLPFPYIIHATLDLDSTRNYPNRTDKNKIVIQKAVTFIIEVAKNLTKQKYVIDKWLPFKMLTTPNFEQNDRMEDLGFYSKLRNAVIEEPIYPCLDGAYRTKDNTVYYQNPFTEYILQNNWSNKLSTGLAPRTSDIEYKVIKIYPPGNRRTIDIEPIINEISQSINSIPKRAKFIYEVIREFPDNRFHFLVDQDLKIITSEEDAFTPASINLHIPSFCRIRCIHKELYKDLLNLFNISGTNRSRKLRDKLSNHSAIFSYEPQPLIQKIISQTNEALAEARESMKGAIIKEMATSLYKNHIQFEEPPKLETQTISLLNADMQTQYSKNLFLSEAFPTGKVAKLIFGDGRNAKNTIISPKKLLEINEEPQVERVQEFLLWLGVNKYAHYVQEDQKLNLNSQQYKYARSKLSIEPTSIDRLRCTTIPRLPEILASLSIENILAWIHVDSELRLQLTNGQHETRITYFYHTTKYNRPAESFVKWSLKNNNLDFSDHLIGSGFKWANERTVNYEHSIFKKLDITPVKINYALELLGAKEEFTDLSITRLKDLILKHPNSFPDGQYSQTLYRNAVDHYRINGNILPPGNYKYFANKGSQLTPLPPDKIYFADNINLPPNIREDYPILNYPPRSGGKKAIEFFGINDLSGISIRIRHHSKLDSLTTAFIENIQGLHPYILLNRLENITKEGEKKEEAGKLKRTDIQLCDSLDFTIDGHPQTIDMHDFIHADDGIYYILCKPNDMVSQLKNSSAFSDTFANIISHVFEITGSWEEIRAIWRDGIEDIRHRSFLQYRSELIEEAKRLLGQGDSRITFWKTIYSLVDRPFQEHLDVKEDLSLETDIDRIDYDSLISKESLNLIRQLFEEIGITVSDYNAASDLKIDLFDYHVERLKNKVFKEFDNIYCAIWFALKDASHGKQKRFLELVHRYEENSFIKVFATKNRYTTNLDVEEFFTGLLQSLNLSVEEISLDISVSQIEEIEKTNRALYDPIQLDKIDADVHLKSLLFFEDTEEAILDEIEEERETVGSDAVDSNRLSSESSDTTDNEDPNNFEFGKGKLKNISSRHGVTAGSNGPYAPPSRNVSTKETGNKSERIVYKYLTTNLGEANVDWVSRRDEGKHYDIRYSNDGGETWIYVEVKTLSKGGFIISSDEVDFANAHVDEYELFLVDLALRKVYCINHPFEEENITLTIKDYNVRCDIERIQDKVTKDIPKE